MFILAAGFDSYTYNIVIKILTGIFIIQNNETELNYKYAAFTCV